MVRLIHSVEEPPESALDREATWWVVHLNSGESTAADHARFRDWKASSEQHRQALRRALVSWQQLGHALPTIERSERRNGSRLGTRAATFAFAASLMLAIGLGHRYRTTWQYDYVTQPGETLAVSLPDGSRMLMSGDTAVDYDGGHGTRRVDLARGEVVLRVRHDAATPFAVWAGSATYRDVGTTFGVAWRGQGSRLVVEEGLVEARYAGMTRRVGPGLALTVSSERMSEVRPVDVASEMAWTRGRLVFRDTPLRTILAGLQPHYAGRVVLLSDAAGETRLTASIRLDRADDWLDALGKTTAVRVRRFGSYTILL